MVYRVSEEDIFAQWKDFRSDYPPFIPYTPNQGERDVISSSILNVITTQNGQDFDDYSITDEDDKVGKYLTDVAKHSSVLIHGVGTGREVLVAKSLGLNATGTTLGSRNVDFGKRYLGLSDKEIIECLVDAVPLSTSTFDVVIGVQLFEHVVSPLPFLLEQTRLLRMGGKLILEWPPASTHTMAENPHHQVCYTPGQAQALFLKAGLGDVRVYYSDMSDVLDGDWWSGEAKLKDDGTPLMLCVEGIKAQSSQEYINKARV